MHVSVWIVLLIRLFGLILPTTFTACNAFFLFKNYHVSQNKISLGTNQNKIDLTKQNVSWHIQRSVEFSRTISLLFGYLLFTFITYLICKRRRMSLKFIFITSPSFFGSHCYTYIQCPFTV